MGKIDDSALLARGMAIFSCVAFVAMIALNAMAVLLPLNGVSTGALSDEIPNLFVPSGFTFSIWGLIYSLLLGFLLFTLAEAFGKKPSGAWTALDGLVFSLNAIANSAWILAWHWRLVGLSLAIMLLILASLCFLNERLHAACARLEAASPLRAFFLRAPIRVYLGWICVATIANATALLVKTGWNGWGLSEAFWAVAAICAGLAVGAALVLLRRSYASALVVVWAFAGIAAKRQGLAEAPEVFWAAVIAAAALLALSAAWRFLPDRKAKDVCREEKA
jgi:hypothetical protein